MDLKKGLSRVAFGFLFLLVNLNLTLNGATLNVAPSFIGWILLFLAVDCLGAYAEDRRWMKGAALALAVLTGAVWFGDIVKPELAFGRINPYIEIASAVFMFLLFGVLERIAHDRAPRREPTLRTLKIINLVLFICLTALAFAVGRAASPMSLAFPSAFLGITALVAAIVTAVVLFQLKGEISDDE